MVQAIVLLLVWAIPASAVWAVSLAARRADEAALAPLVVSYVVVGSQEEAASRAVKVSFTGLKSLGIASPLGGTVVDLRGLRPGRVVRDGEVLLQVGNRRLVASVGGIPFYRVLAPGRRGSDVRRLNDLLASSKLPHESVTPRRFTGRTAAGVRALNSRLGAPAGTSFAPESTIYAPKGATVGVAELIVGQRIDAGAAIGTLQTAPTAAAVLDEQGGQAAVLVSEGASLHAPDGSVFEFGTATKSAEFALPAFRFVLRHGGQLSGDKASLGSAGDGPSYTGFRLVRERPGVVGSVPVTSIHTRQDGGMCLFGQPQQADGPPTPISLTSATDSGRFGVAFVDASLVGQSIVSDVSALPDDTLRRC